jgi:hypothetical protein
MCYVGWLGYIGLNSDNTHVIFVLKLARPDGEAFFIPGAQGQMYTLLRQPLCNRQPDADTPAGHHSYFISKTQIHNIIPCTLCK